MCARFCEEYHVLVSLWPPYVRHRLDHHVLAKVAPVQASEYWDSQFLWYDYLLIDVDKIVSV